MADLSVFLPRCLAPLLRCALGGGEHFAALSGPVLFCDVAGFTPLTEALSRIGREGAEELTRLLNGYFTRMIGILEEEGGDVLRFGGDAMTVLFPDVGPTPALRAAWRMMEAMGEFQSLETRAGVFGLSMKIGAAYGEVLLGLVGDPDVGFDFYAAGSPLDDSAEAEHRASPGLVVCHPSLLARIHKTASTEALEGGFGRLSAPPPEGPARLGADRPFPAPGEILEQVVPKYLADRAGEGVLGEHRGTTVVFVSFRAPEVSAVRECHGGLDGLYRLFARTVRRYGGIVNKLDMGDKGAKAVFLFGSPYAVEHREEMAIRACLDIFDARGPFQGAVHKMGITSAPLFTGPVGSPWRREFTVMGDGINLAARLMQAAGTGQVLCDRATAQGSDRTVSFEALPAILVKGKKEPVQVFRPSGFSVREAGSSTSGHLVERESICEALRKYLFGDGGAPVILVGEAGAGKTALLEWARAETRMRQIPVTRVILAPYSAEQPYSAWRGAVRALVGLEKGDPPQKAADLRERSLSEEPAGFRPLLNPLLDLPEEVTPALRNFSPRERKDLTFAILARLLQTGGERVILQDNLHWADPLSLDLLSFLLQETEPAPWRLVATLRPGTEGSDRAAFALKDLQISPLSESGIEALLARVHGLAEVEPPVRKWFASRSRGNPALVSALMDELTREGLILRDAHGFRVDADRLFATAFPETLEGLYLGRVDRLPRREREVLQAASILGISVSLNLLRKVAGLGAEELGDSVGVLCGAGLLRLDSWGIRPYARFTDSLLRDAVYGAAPFALKREGHLSLARFLEAEGAANPRLWPTLAGHFESGGDHTLARRYHRMAARDAVKRFDNLTALKHLEAVCGTLTPAEDDVEDAFALMDVYSYIGRWENAQGILSTLKTMQEALPSHHQGRLCSFFARDHWQNHRWEEAEKALREGLALYEKAGDASGMGRSLVNLVGGIYGPTGRLDRARECLEKALALPPGPDQAVWRVTAAMNLGAVLKHTGKSAEARESFLAAYQHALRSGLGPQRANVADNLCSLLGEMGDFDGALRWGKKAVALLDTFALRRLSQSGRYNLALAYLAKGRVEEAREIFQGVLRQAEAQGHTQLQAMSHQGLLQSCALRGDLRSAFEHAGLALEHFRDLQNGRDFRFTLLSLGNLYYALDSREAAAEFWSRERAEAFLRRSTPDPAADRGLERVRSWMAGEDPSARDLERLPAGPDDLSSEERLERILWAAEAAATEGPSEILARALPTCLSALRAWPYFDARIRVLLLEAIQGRGLAPARRVEAMRLLKHSMGGVWGLRLLCQLWCEEGARRIASPLRLRALREIYTVQVLSPEWAWSRLRTCPEIRSLLGGRDIS